MTHERSVAVVIDPIQSVKGKVVIDAFRSINSKFIMMGQEPRQTTSNIGHLNKPTLSVIFFLFSFKNYEFDNFNKRQKYTD